MLNSLISEFQPPIKGGLSLLSSVLRLSYLQKFQEFTMPSTVAVKAGGAICTFIAFLLGTKAFLASLDALLDAFIDLGRHTLGCIGYFNPVSDDNNTTNEVSWPQTSANLQRSSWKHHLTEVLGKKTLWTKSFPLEGWDRC
ncbi:MAG: hypothetical protein EOO61_01955 [Hymenobacter sp.]|nr:MAG: hypothetical protein EOO61_01955 [Hymenobacter sp.]